MSITENSLQTLVLLLAGVLFAYLLFAKSGYLNTQSTLPLPPGPKRLPLIGNLLDMPNGFEWVTYERWARQFSKYTLRLSVVEPNLGCRLLHYIC